MAADENPLTVASAALRFGPPDPLGLYTQKRSVPPWDGPLSILSFPSGARALCDTVLLFCRQTFFQVFGLNRMNTGRISSRPSIIVMARTILENAL